MPVTVRDLPHDERPRERLHQFGADSLSISELLQIVLCQGGRRNSVSEISSRLVSKFNSARQLEGAGIQQLSEVPGIGFAKSTQLKAAFELGKRAALEEVHPRSKPVLNSDSAHSLARRSLKHKNKEQLLLFCLNVHGRLICKPEIISVGILDCSIVHPREIFSEAIKHSSAKIMLAHNHPSGNSAPSVPDYEVTRQIYSAGLIMGIELIDHIIIAEKQWASIRELRPDLFG